jgi:hypothetical protein
LIDEREIMSWIKAADRMPPENEPIHIYDARSGRMEVGRYMNGEWFVEDMRSGQLSKISGVAHWAWILDSQINWDSGDD